MGGWCVRVYIVSFFSNAYSYERLVNRLQATLIKLQLPLIEGVSLLIRLTAILNRLVYLSRNHLHVHVKNSII